MNWIDRITGRLLASPILWGGLLSGAVHFTLKKTTLKLPPWLIERLTGHWESYVCTTLFLIALAVVVIRCVGLAIQFRAWQQFEADAVGGEGEEPVALQSRLESLESDALGKRSVLCQRLRDVRQFLARHEAAAALTTHVKELSDADYDR